MAIAAFDFLCRMCYGICAGHVPVVDMTSCAVGIVAIAVHQHDRAVSKVLLAVTLAGMADIALMEYAAFFEYLIVDRRHIGLMTGMA
jgi:hypothetical protein